MDTSLDLRSWLSRPPRQLSNEELSSLVSLLTRTIRKNGIPRLKGLKPDINANPKLTKELQEWEKNLTVEIATEDFIGRRTIRERLGCRIIKAYYNGAGSFEPVPEHRYNHRNNLAHTVLAQAALISLYDKTNWLIETDKQGADTVNSLYKLAKGVLNADGHFFILPLHALNDGHEYFHGVVIAIFEKDKPPNEETKTKLGYYIHRLGAIMGESRLYSFPAIDGGRLQYIEKELLGDKLEGSRARPSSGLWCGADHQHDAHQPFDKMILENISFCRRFLERKGVNELIPLVSRALKDVFNAEECYFIRHNDNASEHRRLVAITAMIGAPYQAVTGQRTVLAIPHYVGGKTFIGASIIILAQDKPLMTSRFWRRVLCFCHHTFNTIYAPTDEAPQHLYSDEYPWHAFIEMTHCANHRDDTVFPPFLPRTENEMQKFGKKELSQISDWLVKSMRQLDFPWGTGITCIEELKYYAPEDTVMEVHQTTTNTILDLCNQACREDWRLTMHSIFGEAEKFFKGEKISLMWLALHRGDGRFNIYHSSPTEFDEEDNLVCEILAQQTTLQNGAFFVASDDPDPYARLLHGKIGDHSFISIPVYQEDETTVDPDGWHKNPGGLIGVFTVVVQPKRPEPSHGEWHTWGMFIPRLCLVIRKAKEAGRVSYCTNNADFGGDRLVIDKLWLR